MFFFFLYFTSLLLVVNQLERFRSYAIRDVSLFDTLVALKELIKLPYIGLEILTQQISSLVALLCYWPKAFFIEKRREKSMPYELRFALNRMGSYILVKNKGTEFIDFYKTKVRLIIKSDFYFRSETFLYRGLMNAVFC